MLAALAACQTPAPVAIAAPDAPAEASVRWRSVVLPEDLARLEGIAESWAEALAAARRSGFARQIGSEGALLDPDAALPWAVPPPGPYRCRIVRLGAPGRNRAFAAFPPFFCHVADADGQLSLTKQTGSERPGGYLWADGERNRLIFIGAVARGAERMPPAYGETRERDMVGVLERVGQFRYRLATPAPRGAAILDVMEMIPVVDAN